MHRTKTEGTGEGSGVKMKKGGKTMEKKGRKKIRKKIRRKGGGKG